MNSIDYKYKMCALDLDGTLLNSAHRISGKSVRSLQRLHRKGFKIAIASGRSPAACAGVVDTLDLHNNENGFFVVTTNGARGIKVIKYNGANGNKTESRDSSTMINTRIDNPMTDGRMLVSELFHLPLPVEIAEETLSLAKRLGCVTNYYIEHDIVANAEKESHFAATRRYSELTGVPFVYVQDNYESSMERGPPSKLIILCNDNDVDEVYHEAIRVLGARAKVIRGSPPWFVEVLHKDVNKGIGLQLLCQYLNIEMRDVISFGDGDNDIEFLQMSGLGIAMKNARDNVKAVADLETDLTNDEDGVVHMLEKLEVEGKLHFSD